MYGPWRDSRAAILQVSCKYLDIDCDFAIFVDSTELFTSLSSDFAVCLPTDCRLHVVEELIQRCQRYTTATDCFCTLCNYWVHINFTQNKRCLHKTQLSLHLPCSCSKTHTVSSNRESKLHVKYLLYIFWAHLTLSLLTFFYCHPCCAGILKVIFAYFRNTCVRAGATPFPIGRRMDRMTR